LRRTEVSCTKQRKIKVRVFVTGASGFIGSAVVKELLNAGHEVTGLVRSKQSAETLAAMGVRPHIGSIEDVESLRRGAADAHGAIHTAFFHQITHMSIPSRLRVMLGGSPGGIVLRFMKAAVDADKRAIETLGNALTGNDRAIVAAFPTMALRPGRLATEEDAPDPHSAGGGRAPSEAAALALVSIGVRSSVVRLPPLVHDRQKQGLATRMTEIAKKRGVSAYVGTGSTRWAAVHRLDAAHLFRVALESGSAGARYHAVAEAAIPVRRIAEVISQNLDVPAVSKSSKEAAKLFSWLTPFIEADNPVSSQLTQERLGWRPVRSGIISDLGGADEADTSRRGSVEDF
jgi:nucleoside-diphosphate-sugar epimerase